MFRRKASEAKLGSHQAESKWSISFVEETEDFELGHPEIQGRHLGEIGEGQDCASGNTTM